MAIARSTQELELVLQGVSGGYPTQKVILSSNHQNFRFFFTASRLSSWICSVSGMSLGQTFVQENCV